MLFSGRQRDILVVSRLFTIKMKQVVEASQDNKTSRFTRVCNTVKRALKYPIYIRTIGLMNSCVLSKHLKSFPLRIEMVWKHKEMIDKNSKDYKTTKTQKTHKQSNKFTNSTLHTQSTIKKIRKCWFTWFHLSYIICRQNIRKPPPNNITKLVATK